MRGGANSADDSGMARPTFAAPTALVALAGLVACSASAPVPGDSATPAGGTSAGGSGRGGGGGAATTGGSAGGGVALGGSNSSPPEACASANYPAGRVPASLLFVFDRSGSMDEGVNGKDKGGPTKWAVAVEAVSTALGAIDVDFDAGFNLFPAGKFDDSKLAGCFIGVGDKAMCKAIQEDNGCKDIAQTPNILMAPIKETGPKIQALLAKTDPTGGTPTRWALKYGWDYLKSLPTAGERYVVLVTDGQPNTYQQTPLGTTGLECGTLGQIAQEVTAATTGSPPVKTFVIGSPGDTDPKVLSGLALNGGTAKEGCNATNYEAKECHYQLEKNNFGDGLVAALKEIAGKASKGCTFAVPAGANADPSFVNVAAQGPAGDAEIFKDELHAAGWDYTDEGKTNVEIFGDTCEKLKNGELTSVKVITGCQTKVAK